MRCLYCGKELAFLKRLTGGGEFCSDTHKQSYQEEYNRLALSRLLQAQTKAEDNKIPAKAAPAQPPSAPLPAKFQDEPVERLQPSVPEPEPMAEEMAPAAMASFMVDRPNPRASAEAVPLAEDPLCDPPRPAMPSWEYSERGAAGWTAESGAPVQPASLFDQAARPLANGSARFQIEAGVAPREFSSPPVSLDLKLSGSLPVLGHAGAVEIRVSPLVAEGALDRTLETVLEFSAGVPSTAPARPDFAGTGIEMRAADADLAIVESSTPLAAEPLAPEELSPEAEEHGGSPRAALEALSRLRHELVERELEPAARAAQAETGPIIDRFAFERLFGTPAAPAATPVTAISRPAAVSRSTTPVSTSASSGGVLVAAPEIEIADEPEPTATAGRDLNPRGLDVLVDLGVKPFAPPKAKLAPGFQAFTAGPQAQLPRVASLPLRPKLALGTTAPAVPDPAPPAEAKKPSPERKKVVPPTVRSPQGRTAAALAKSAAQTESKDKEEPAPRQPQNAPPLVVEPAVPEKPRPPIAAAAVAPEVKPPVPETTPPVTKKSAALEENLTPLVPTPQRPASEAKASEAKASEAKAPEAKAPEATPPAGADISFSSFNLDASSQANRSFWSALPAGARLGIGLALLVLIAFVLYTRSKPTPRDAGAIGDGAGPSIMMGDSGWVSAWGGDTTGLHKGREITIYQPSLKLSDYRIEFQGQIESNCVAWVFRASDPLNYYAMKLSIPNGKVLLSKSVVVGGKEMTAGATATSIVGFPGKTYEVRMDVRGSKFTTFVQGEQADTWTDDQLKQGGVGLLNDRGDRAQVRAFTIRYLTAK